MAAAQTAEWVFDALPPSGARRGGDPAEHVFHHDLDTFVREVVQNANDQRSGNPNVDFSFAELTADQLKSCFDFDGLRPHLEAASAGHGGRRVRTMLEGLGKTKKLLVLRIEDRGTHGLTGGEDEPGSHFRALCKDTLFSHKGTLGSAGGSYGLGKSVLWAFSGLSTVVFNSVPRVVPGGMKAPRLIARAELPSHVVGSAEFAGPGWFGRRVSTSKGERAESVWSLSANTIARDLGLAREQLDSGTSILIVGFREPAADEEESREKLSQRIGRAAAHWFWPAMSLEGRQLSVSIDGKEPIAPGSFEDIHPFVDCYRNRRSQRETLDEAGDVVVRELDFTVPATRDGKPTHKGSVRLIVRLAADGAHDSLMGHVALFRGAGMVVRYLDRRNVALGARPFHTVLAAGEARQPEAPTTADRAIESFLRLAEPPGHDEWGSTNALKETYQRGYAKALDELLANVARELRALLAPNVAVGTRGPERLMKRFPFGATGRPGSAPTAFHFSRLDARLTAGRWVFKGEIQPATRGGRWQARICLNESGDDRARLGSLGIVRLDASKASVRLQDGVAQLDVGKGVETLAFEGESERLAGAREGVLDLEVTGSREVLP